MIPLIAVITVIAVISIITVVAIITAITTIITTITIISIIAIISVISVITIVPTRRRVHANIITCFEILALGADRRVESVKLSQGHAIFSSDVVARVIVLDEVELGAVVIDALLSGLSCNQLLYGHSFKVACFD